MAKEEKEFVMCKGKKIETFYHDHSSFRDNLVCLNLGRTKIRDITDIGGLENLTNLQELIITESKRLSRIRGLENLTNLLILDLNDNRIKEITGLENLTNLQELKLSGNRIRK